jgi:hypothetical protein
VNELKSPDKPFEISKWAVQRAWEKVKANKGAPGVDEVAIGAFEADLQSNLYKVWNRMSSGSYFPLRCVRWRYRSRMAEGPECWVCLLSLTEWRKRW